MHRIKNLRLIVVGTGLEDAEINPAPRDHPTRHDYLLAIWRESQSLPTEDELIDKDIFEDFIFFHRNFGGKL